MFHKLKQFKDMRDQAKTLQNALAQHKVSHSHGGMTMEMDGNGKVTDLQIPEEMTAKAVQMGMPKLIDDTNEKVKKVMAEQMKAMGGFPGMPGGQS